MLEVGAAATGDRVLVGDRIAERAGLPADVRPGIADAAVDLVGPEHRRPVDRAPLEHAVAADVVGCAALLGHRHAEDRRAAAELAVLAIDLADDQRRATAPRARGLGPERDTAGLVDRTTEAVEIRLVPRVPAAPVGLAAVVVAHDGLDPLIAEHGVGRIEPRDPGACLVVGLGVGRVRRDLDHPDRVIDRGGGLAVDGQHAAAVPPDGVGVGSGIELEHAEAALLRAARTVGGTRDDRTAAAVR